MSMSARVKLVVAAGWAVSTSQVLAVAVLTSGSATITHTGNLGGAMDVRTINVSTIPSINLGSPVPLQYNPSTPISNGLAISRGRAGLASTVSPTVFGLQFAPTTLLTQSGNSNPSPAAASVLRYDFNASWLIQGAPYGPGSTAGLQLSLIANVPASASAFTEVIAQVNFTYIASPGGPSALLRTAIPTTPFFYQKLTPGSEIATPSNITAALPGTLAVGAVVMIEGFLQFRVHNDMNEASVELIGGGASPTDPTAVPAPGLAGMLVMGGVLAARRRR